MSSCIYKPTVSIDGVEYESRLFNELMQYTKGNRKSAVELYSIMTSPSVKADERIILDELGEPTLSSFLDMTGANNKLVGVDNTFDEVKAGLRDNNGSVVFDSTTDANGAAQMYNNTHNNKVAIIGGSPNKRTVSIQDKNIVTEGIVSEQKSSIKLNTRIREILKSLGFTDVVDTEMKFEGIFDPLNARKTADGLIAAIRIADGELGENALPEEFSHLIIAGMKNNPLVQRLLNITNQEGIAEAILGDEHQSYFNMYDGNQAMIAEEAAGKLLAKALKGEQVSVEHLNIRKQAQSLLRRIWEAFKAMIGKASTEDIREAINEANMLSKGLSKDVLSGNLKEFDKKAVTEMKGKLYKIATKISSLDVNVSNLMENVRRMYNVRKQKYNEDYQTMHEDERKRFSTVMREAEELLKSGSAMQSGTKLMSEMSLQITEAIDAQEQARVAYNAFLEENPSASIENRMAALNKFSKATQKLKDIAELYGPALQAMTEMYEDYRMNKILSLDKIYTESDFLNLKHTASDILATLNTLQAKYEHDKKHIAIELIDAFLPEGVYEGNRQEFIDGIIARAPQDIGFMDRWLTSLADSNDIFSGIIARYLREAEAKASLIMGEMRNEIMKGHNKLEMSGVKNTGFLLERDSDGNKTGRVISNIDYDKFYKAKSEHYKKLKDNPSNSRTKIHAEMKKWEMDNTEEVTMDTHSGPIMMRLPKHRNGGEYYSGTLDRAGFSKAQMEYYNHYIMMKASLDNLLPGEKGNNIHKAIQMRMDTMEGMLTKGTDKKNILKQNLLSAVKRVEDDTDFGMIEDDMLEEGEKEYNESVVETDGEGRIIKRVPVFYRNKLKDMSLLTEDITSALLAYSQMAVHYSVMSEVADNVEIMADVARDRIVQEESGEKKLVRKVTRGGKEETEAIGERGGAIYDRIRVEVNRIVYREYKLDEGEVTIFKYTLDKAKVIDELRAITSTMALGGNVLGAMNNVIAGRMQLMYEAFAGEYFTYKDTFFAEKEYQKEMYGYIGQVYSNVKTNKLMLMEELIDPSGDMMEKTAHTKVRANSAQRAFNGTNMLMGYSMGEHYLRSKVMLAYMNNMKLKDANGKPISAWDAYEVEKEMHNGKVIGAKLKLKEGITKEDGTEFTQKDLIDMRMRIRGINQNLNGAMNEIDKGAVHQYAMGRALTQFRQWMVKHITRRYARKYYNAYLNEEVEGYMRTMYGLGMSMWKNQGSIYKRFLDARDAMTPHQRANMIRGITEISAMIVTGILASLLLASDGDDDDDEKSWLKRLVLYQTLRLNMEINSFIPSHKAPEALVSLVNKPMAAIGGLSGMFKLISVWNLFRESESNEFYGQSVWWQENSNNIPIWSKMDQFINIDENDTVFKPFR